MQYSGSRNHLVFECSHRRLYVHAGVVGIGEELVVSGGYDDIIDITDPNWVRVDESDPFPLTPEERAELADYMIARWTAFKNKGA